METYEIPKGKFTRGLPINTSNTNGMSVFTFQQTHCRCNTMRSEHFLHNISRVDIVIRYISYSVEEKNISPYITY